MARFLFLVFFGAGAEQNYLACHIFRHTATEPHHYCCHTACQPEPAKNVHQQHTTNISTMDAPQLAAAIKDLTTEQVCALCSGKSGRHWQAVVSAFQDARVVGDRASRVVVVAVVVVVVERAGLMWLSGPGGWCVKQICSSQPNSPAPARTPSVCLFGVTRFPPARPTVCLSRTTRTRTVGDTNAIIIVVDDEQEE